jgi:hypothetical protein
MIKPAPNASPIITMSGGPPALPPEKVEPPLPLLRERKLLLPEPRQLICNLLCLVSV